MEDAAMKKSVKLKASQLASRLTIGVFCLLGLVGESLNATQDANPLLKIGIVQRFGANPQDKLTIKAVDGDKLNLSFLKGDGKGRQTISTDKVVIEIAKQPQEQPSAEEKIILSHHRSFENAAASSNRWQAKGIETEIAQPRRWQVWAKRSTYDTPLLRNMLLYGLRNQGYNIAQLETKVTSDRPILSWIAGTFRYNRDTLDISSSRGLFEVNQRLYAGTLRVQPNAHQSYTLVNQVPLETYLRGVVPHEIGYNAPFAAVQAQAVLARTYVLASRHRFEVDNYELCANTQCQVYQGLEDTSKLADQAIASTKGKVLTFGNKVVDALYSSTTGGVTADYNDLWDGKPRPYLRSIVDSVSNSLNLTKLDLSNEANFRTFINKREGFNEQGWDAFRWKADSSLAEIKGTLLEFLRLSGDTETRFNQVKQITVQERSPSGRVLKIEIETDTKKIILEKDEIIDALYAPSSTLFYIQPIYNDADIKDVRKRKGLQDGKEIDIAIDKSETKTLKGYSFIGGGLGHGVGMSQTGSYHLGKLGWSYERILDFYYAGTKLQTLKPEFLLDEEELSKIKENKPQDETSMQSDTPGAKQLETAP